MAADDKTKKEIPTVVLTPEEEAILENRRKEMQKVESFKVEYGALVQKYGFAWVVDTNSPMNAPLLGIAKVTIQ